MTNKEKNEFIEYTKNSFTATIARGKQCQHFSSFYGNGKYPRCLLNEYTQRVSSERILTLEEASQICPFFNPELIETKCIYLRNYPIEEVDIEDGERRYIKEIGDLLKVKLGIEINEKEKIEEQIKKISRHLHMSEEPPTKHEDFEEWMKQIIIKIRT